MKQLKFFESSPIRPIVGLLTNAKRKGNGSKVKKDDEAVVGIAKSHCDVSATSVPKMAGSLY